MGLLGSQWFYVHIIASYGVYKQGDLSTELQQVRALWALRSQVLCFLMSEEGDDGEEDEAVDGDGEEDEGGDEDGEDEDNEVVDD
ncbi:hypothetical protein NM688_g1831 [Phlebia brevispora]|uniref:Uncharacterized protein n=1 Tax=Phlebia brevispora TaxID=194682 RepID=A0ACC1TA74_9APHY|nr:hypothetical protein NM688_g1831 [Phlebia brevispora]